MAEFSKRKPNLFIVGMPRSGTTSVYLYLKQHPQIYLSILKEPHFFGKDLPNLNSYIRTKNEYFSLFDGVKNEKIIGEGSVWYLESQSAIEEIYQFNPEAKLVIILRNPVDMIFSLHSLYLRTGNEDVQYFYDAFKLCENRGNGMCLPKSCYYAHGLNYKEVGLYNQKISRAFRIFGKESVHIIVFEDLVNFPDNTYQKLLEFLDAENFSPYFTKKEAEKAIQNRVLNQLKTTSPDVRNKIRQKRINLHEKTKNSSLSAEQRKVLLTYFKEDIIATGNLINTNLSHWFDF